MAEGGKGLYINTNMLSSDDSGAQVSHWRNMALEARPGVSHSSTPCLEFNRPPTQQPTPPTSSHNAILQVTSSWCYQQALLIQHLGQPCAFTRHIHPNRMASREPLPSRPEGSCWRPRSSFKKSLPASRRKAIIKQAQNNVEPQS